MKQVITLLAAVVITLTSFASVNPGTTLASSLKSAVNDNATIKINLTASAKVNIAWTAGAETTTTVYHIEKSVNGSDFKTIAMLMGESNDSYIFRDSIKGVSGNVVYRVIMVDNNVTVKTLTQSLLIL